MAYSLPRTSNTATFRQGNSAPRHAFVPVESLSSSPTSSTGSASVLEWNSNSDGGDIFRLSPPIQSAYLQQQQQPAQQRLLSGTHPAAIYDFTSVPSSPSSLGLSNADDQPQVVWQSPTSHPLTATVLDNDPFLAQWEITAMDSPVSSQGAFADLTPPAPVADDMADAVAGVMGTSTVVMDDDDAPAEECHTPLSAQVERLSLQDMVHAWNTAVLHEENTVGPSKAAMSEDGSISVTTATPSPATPPSFQSSQQLPTPQSANRPNIRRFSLFDIDDETRPPSPASCPGRMSPTHSDLSYASAQAASLIDVNQYLASADDRRSNSNLDLWSRSASPAPESEPQVPSPGEVESGSSVSVIIEINPPSLPSCFLSRDNYTTGTNPNTRDHRPRHSMDLLPTDALGSAPSLEGRADSPLSEVSAVICCRSPSPLNRSRSPSTARSPSPCPVEVEATPLTNRSAPVQLRRIWSDIDATNTADTSTDTPAPSWLPATVSTGALPTLVDAFESSTGPLPIPPVPVVPGPKNSSTTFSWTYVPGIPAEYSQQQPGMVSEMSNIPSWLKDPIRASTSSSDTNAKTSTATAPRQRPPLPPLPKPRTPELSLRPDHTFNRALPNTSVNSYARVQPSTWHQHIHSGRSTPWEISIESPPSADTLRAAPLLASPAPGPALRSTFPIRSFPPRLEDFEPERASPVLSTEEAISALRERMKALRNTQSFFSPEEGTTNLLDSTPPPRHSLDLGDADERPRFDLFDSRESTPSPVPFHSPYRPASPSTASTASPRLSNLREDRGRDSAVDFVERFERSFITRERRAPASDVQPNSGRASAALPPQQQPRRLRFAPLPSTPGSSLRASMYSPYSYTAPPPVHQYMPSSMRNLPPPSQYYPIHHSYSRPGTITPRMPPNWPHLHGAAAAYNPIPPNPWVSPSVPPLPPSLDLHHIFGPAPWGESSCTRYRSAPMPSSSLVSPPEMTHRYSSTGPGRPPQHGPTLAPLQNMHRPGGSGIAAPVPAPQLATPHSVFWFSDGTVVFRVEDCLYKVHRYFFERHSEHFRILLGTRPVSMGPSPYSPPFFLADTKKVDFEKLLCVFYPSSLTTPDLITVSDWSSVLSLANKYSMTELKQLAVQKLTPIASSADKIALAKKYNMVGNDDCPWLVPAYTDLCSRNAPLGLDEAEKLDIATVLKIWEVQHEISNWPGMYYHPAVEQLVREKFELV